MGQKTNPNIYRLGINKEWKTEFFEKKNKEFAIFSYIDIEIQSYIERFLNLHGLLLHDYKVHYNNSIITVYISYCATTFKLKKKHKLKLINSKNKKEIIIDLNKKSKKTLEQKTTTKNSVARVNNFFFKKTKYHNIKKYLAKYKNGFFSNLKKNRFSILFKTNLKKTLNSNKNKTITYKNLYSIKMETYIKKFIESLTLLRYNKNDVIVNMHCINNDINLTHKQKQSLKKKILLLQRFKNNDLFKESIDIMFLTIYKKNSAKLLSEFIKLQLKKIKRQKLLINFLKKTLTLFLNSNFSNVNGIKIKIKGRLNGVPRAKHKIINIGNIPTQTIDSIINYSESTVHNPNGSYGIKVWIIEKN